MYWNPPDPTAGEIGDFDDNGNEYVTDLAYSALLWGI